MLAMGSHPQPVRRFFTLHGLDSLSHRPNVVAAPHRRQGTEHQAQPDRKPFRERMPERATGSRSHESNLFLGQRPKDPVLDEFEIASVKRANPDSPLEMRCGRARHLPDLVAVVTSAAVTSPQLVAGNGSGLFR